VNEGWDYIYKALGYNGGMHVKWMLLVALAAVIGAFALFLYQWGDPDEKLQCAQYAIEHCPGDCRVCPPCPECSSLRCGTAYECRQAGFDKAFSDTIRSRLP